VATLAPWLAQADGVTISGGEPFDQSAALAELVAALRRHTSGDVLVFSGYAHEKLFAEHEALTAQLDVLISEPFVAGAGQTLALRGSDNQRVFLLSELARARYPADLDKCPWPAKRRLDVVVEGDAVWMAGIPHTGEMARLRQELARRGFACQTSDQPAPLVRA
jgi:anaerobic ribonucleoside-triphosphate reductase activating protein